MMSIDLSNRVCLVTGAGQGIGASVAKGFARRGAIVVASDLAPPAYGGAGNAGVALSLAWDVADAERAGAVVAQVVARFGRIDCLVANAGIYPKQEFLTMSPEQWRQMMAINLDGAFHGAKAVAEPMKQRGYGKIVTVTSITVPTGRGELVHYVTSKAGIIGMTYSLARALGRYGIRVNSIMPGAVRTEGELRDYPDQAAVAKKLAELQCLPQRIESDDIEPPFAFLCAAESDAITGQVLCVDHGLVHW